MSAIPDDNMLEVEFGPLGMAAGGADFFEDAFTRSCGGQAGRTVSNGLMCPVPRLLKRFSDLALSLVGGPLIVPMLLVIALLVRLTSRGPVLYGHRRIGQDGRSFLAWKFRTMHAEADSLLQRHLEEDPAARDEWQRNRKLKIDPRVTAFGRLLRKLSFDEFPQLWNVLKGEMSLVGPRPIVDAEIEKYGMIFAQYKKVRPGITGLWQVSGRNDTSYLKRVQMDDYYVRNWSPWLDLYILGRTVVVLFNREGAY